MTEEFRSSGNHEDLSSASLPKRVSPDAAVNRSPLLAAPENQPFCELLQESENYLQQWHAILSAPEYLIDHAKDKDEERWHRGFDVVQSGADLHVVPLPKEQGERPEGGIVRITSWSVVYDEYKYYPYDRFFIPLGETKVQIATLTDLDSNLPLHSFGIEIETLQKDNPGVIDPYNQQPLTDFSVSTYRANVNYMRTNPVKQKYGIRFICQTYDAQVRRMDNRLRSYSAQYTVKKNRLNVRRSAPFSKFLTADHSKALLALMDSLMPQEAALAQDEGEQAAQQKDTYPNEM